MALTLPECVKEGDGGGGAPGLLPLSPISMAIRALPPSRAGNVAAVRSVRTAAPGDSVSQCGAFSEPHNLSPMEAAATNVPTGGRESSSASEAMLAPGAGRERPRAEDATLALEGNERVRPLTNAVNQLSDALQALRPAVIAVSTGGVDTVLEAVGALSAATREAKALAEGGEAGVWEGVEAEAEAEAEVTAVDDEEVEAAAAILAEANDSAEALAQVPLLHGEGSGLVLVCLCVCVCVFIKLHITTQSGPVILVILCHSH